MDFEINKTKYLALVGHIQSGKTNEEINYCFSSVNHYKTSVIFIVRNVTADQIQLHSRFENLPVKLPVKLLNEIITVEEAVEFLKSTGIIILLCNTNQLLKIKKILKIYQGDYNLCIDEVDFSIKTKDLVTSTDMLMEDVKNSANHILGATATPFALFLNERNITKFKKMKPSRNYNGIESLDVKYITDTKIIYDSILYLVIV